MNQPKFFSRLFFGSGDPPLDFVFIFQFLDSKQNIE